MDSPNKSGNKGSAMEQGIGILILLCLAVIAAGVYRKQFSFNPAVLAAASLAPAAAKRPLHLRPPKRRQPCRRNSRC